MESESASEDSNGISERVVAEVEPVEFRLCAEIPLPRVGVGFEANRGYGVGELAEVELIDGSSHVRGVRVFAVRFTRRR